MAVVIIGLAVTDDGYWFARFLGLFMVVLSSKREREREREREMEEKRKNKKNNKEIIFK